MDMITQILTRSVTGLNWSIWNRLSLHPLTYILKTVDSTIIESIYHWNQLLTRWIVFILIFRHWKFRHGIFHQFIQSKPDIDGWRKVHFQYLNHSIGRPCDHDHEFFEWQVCWLFEIKDKNRVRALFMTRNQFDGSSIRRS